jgi:hypothetical protein
MGEFDILIYIGPGEYLAIAKQLVVAALRGRSREQSWESSQRHRHCPTIH